MVKRISYRLLHCYPYFKDSRRLLYLAHQLHMWPPALLDELTLLADTKHYEQLWRTILQSVS